MARPKDHYGPPEQPFISTFGFRYLCGCAFWVIAVGFLFGYPGEQRLFPGGVDRHPIEFFATVLGLLGASMYVNHILKRKAKR